MTLAKSDTFLALNPDGMDILKANLPLLAMNPWDMDRAKVPAGGGISWEIPDLDEGSKSVKSLEGIILYFGSPRAYWRSGLDEGDGAGPPDCSSQDGVLGTGDPGGACATCALNQWGSAIKGDGKACKEKRMLFLLQPHTYLPLLIQVPTMSIRPMSQYLMRLASSGTMYFNVVTGLSLERSQQRGGGGLTYSKMVFRKVRSLSGAEIEAVKTLAETLRGMAPKSTTWDKALNDA